MNKIIYHNKILSIQCLYLFLFKSKFKQQILLCCSDISEIIRSPTYIQYKPSYVIQQQTMCVTFFCIQPKNNQLIKFIMAFNREEQTARKTLPFGPFQQDKNIYGGRDLISGGTWLGINLQTGILVFLTNYDLIQTRFGQSRGQLVYSFLKTDFTSKQKGNELDQKIDKQLEKVAAVSQNYSAFNLTVCNLRTRKTSYLCSERKPNCPVELQHGIVHGICNSDKSQIWPKTALGIDLFTKVVQGLDHLNEEQIFKKMKKICQNKTRFSQKDEDQSSILVQPYYNCYQDSERRTKSTFLLMMKQRQNDYQLLLSETTYKGAQMKQQQLCYRLSLNK